jgi:amino acid transporter
MLQPRKVLAFAFWELRRVLNAISDDSWLEFRAMSLLVCTQMGLILNFLGIVSILLKRSFIPTHGLGQTLFIALLAAAITALNYYGVQYKNRWKQFEGEFDGYSKSIKAIGGFIVIVLPILTGAAMSWTAMTMARLSL